MYKGTVKKWQLLDDHAHDRDQVEKLQVAISAPLPEELEMYKEKHAVPFTLPINNANASAWRDETRAIDDADFDIKQLEYEQDKRKKWFIERFEKVKEIADH